MPFSGNELKRFNDFVRSLYVPQTEAALRKTVTQGILSLVHGENAVSCNFDMRINSVFDETPLIPFRNGANVDKLTSFFPDHPVFLAVNNPAFQGHYVISDLISRAQWLRKDVYNEFYRVNGMEDEWALMMGEPQSPMNVIVILRQKRGFSDKDRQKLALLVPHLEQAFQNARDFNGAIPLALAAQAHAELTEGMILLDEQRRILHCSESTRYHLDTFFPSVIHRPDRLPIELEAQLHAPSPGVFKKNRNHQTLEIHFYRDKSRRRYLLTTQLLDAQASISQLNALGLSPRETEVLYWVGQGKRNDEIATILKLSIHTVKTHIKSIFHRLGVETRTAAAAAAIPFLKR